MSNTSPPRQRFNLRRLWPGWRVTFGALLVLTIAGHAVLRSAGLLLQSTQLRTLAPDAPWLYFALSAATWAMALLTGLVAWARSQPWARPLMLAAAGGYAGQRLLDDWLFGQSDYIARTLPGLALFALLVLVLLAGLLYWPFGKSSQHSSQQHN